MRPRYVPRARRAAVAAAMQVRGDPAMSWPQTAAMSLPAVYLPAAKAPASASATTR